MHSHGSPVDDPRLVLGVLPYPNQGSHIQVCRLATDIEVLKCVGKESPNGAGGVGRFALAYRAPPTSFADEGVEQALHPNFERQIPNPESESPIICTRLVSQEQRL